MANVITVIRLLLVPIIFSLLAWQNAGADKAAFILFSLAALSDLVDGQIARRFSGVSEFGRIVDPFADRALILAGLLGLLVHGAIPAWAFIALMSRDFVMIFGYCLAKALKKPLVPVNQFGRATNFYLMASIVVLLFQVAFLESEIFTWFFDLGVILYITSGLVYIIQEIALLNKKTEEQTV